jgi:D-beta-D-heptose 7-phosphate kinase/D-beta-D-heptose 1-phosphate adenosyltransferase
MKAYLDRFPDVRVAVIGDLILDSYLSGEVSRISPEAPVPVMRAVHERAVAGGAANVAANLAALGAQVCVVGLAGRDAACDELVACLAGLGRVDCTGIVTTPDRRTTKKLRIIGAQQQIVRIDHEDVGPLDPTLEDACVAAAAAAVDSCDVVVLSDYGKGVCSDRVLEAVIVRAARSGKRVLIDPKRRDFSAYRGGSVLTPNRKELADATGLPCETDEQAAAAAAAAQDACGADILLTRSEKGMSYFPVGDAPFHLATVAQHVFDVSGAGDTVVAVMAVALGAAAPVVDAMRMANHAAGIVVSKPGTATVTRAELAAHLSAEQTAPEADDGRLLTWDEAAARRWGWARERLTVGLCTGGFDSLRPADVALIRQAAMSCDRLVVALHSDASAARLPGQSRAAQDETARAAVVGAIKGVSAVVVFDAGAPLALVQALLPDVLVEGSDRGKRPGAGADVVRARGGRVVLVDLEAGHSASNLVAAAHR